MKNKFLLIIFSLLVILSTVLFGICIVYNQYKFLALEMGNILMASICIVSYFLMTRQISSKNPNAFVRGILSGSILKLFTCMAAMIIYILVNRAHLHKPTIFALLGIYAVYTVIETSMLSKIAKEV